MKASLGPRRRTFAWRSRWRTSFGPTARRPTWREAIRKSPSGQSLSSGQLTTIYGFTDLDGSQPDARRYVPEVQDAGKPADASG